MSQVPAVDRRPLQRRRRGPGRHPVRDLSVGPLLQEGPVQGGRASTSRPTTGTATYTMPDGSIVPWDYDTARKIALLLTVDENGKDATEAGFDPEKIVQWGFEPQRDDLRQVGAYWKAGSFVGRRWQDRRRSRTPGPPPGTGSTTASGRTTSASTGPQFQNTDFNPDGYPFFTGKVAMSENYLWSTLRRRRRRRRLEHGGHAVLPGPDDGRLQRRHVPHPQVEQAPRRGVQGPASTCSSNEDLLKLYGGMPAVESEQDAFLQSAAGRTTPSPSTGTSPRRASTSPTSRTSSRYMPAYNQTLDLLNTFGTKWQSTPGLDLDAEIADLKTQMQAIWDKAATDRWRPPASRARAASLASPGWPGGARAGGTSSSRRGSSGSSLFTAFPMVATFVFTFTNINLAQDEPLRFVGLENYADAPRRPADLGRRCGSPSSSRPWRCRSRSSCRSSSRCMLHSRHLRGSGVFRVLFFLPYVVPFVAGVLIWGGMLNGDTGWINGFLEAIGIAASAGLARGPDLDLPGPRDHGRVGDRGRHDRLPRRPQGHPDRPLRGGPDRRRGCLGVAAPHHDPDDVAGHLLHDRARRSWRCSSTSSCRSSSRTGTGEPGGLDAVLQPVPVQELLHVPEHVVRRDAGLAAVRRSRWS